MFPGVSRRPLPRIFVRAAWRHVELSSITSTTSCYSREGVGPRFKKMTGSEARVMRPRAVAGRQPIATNSRKTSPHSGARRSSHCEESSRATSSPPEPTAAARVSFTQRWPARVRRQPGYNLPLRHFNSTGSAGIFFMPRCCLDGILIGGLGSRTSWTDFSVHPSKRRFTFASGLSNPQPDTGHSDFPTPGYSPEFTSAIFCQIRAKILLRSILPSVVSFAKHFCHNRALWVVSSSTFSATPASTVCCAPANPSIEPSLRRVFFSGNQNPLRFKFR